MAFRTALTTGGTHIDEDYMFVNSDNNFPNGYDDTTAPSNETILDYSEDDRRLTQVSVGSGRIAVGQYIHDLDGNLITNLAPADLSSIAIGSDRIVVGAANDDDNGTNSGSAYIFDLNGNLIIKITPFDGASDDFFGRSVAVGSGRIVVGADGDNDNGSDSGSAYIFDLDGNELAKITASDGDQNDYFGVRVAVGSGRIVIGSNNGAAYIYDTNGILIDRINAFDSGAGFGQAVSVGSGRIVVGARFDSDFELAAGSIYIYDLNGVILRKIAGPFANGVFGSSVSVGSGRIVVGAPDDTVGTVAFGSAYIFDLDGEFIERFVASNASGADIYGGSVVVGSGRIVVGKVVSDSRAAHIYETPNITHTLDIF